MFFRSSIKDSFKNSFFSYFVMEISDIEAEMGELTKVEYPNALSSGGLGPCIAIGFYDPRTKSGYMMHEPSVKLREPEIERMMDIIREDYGSLSRLRVGVTGRSICGREGMDGKRDALEERASTERILTQRFKKSQLKVNLSAASCGASK